MARDFLVVRGMIWQGIATSIWGWGAAEHPSSVQNNLSSKESEIWSSVNSVGFRVEKSWSRGSRKGSWRKGYGNSDLKEKQKSVRGGRAYAQQGQEVFAGGIQWRKDRTGEVQRGAEKFSRAQAKQGLPEKHKALGLCP